MHPFSKATLTIVFTVLSLIALFELYERYRYTERIPPALQANIILHKNIQSFDDRIRGVIVFSLPSEVASKIQKEGITFFDELTSLHDREHRTWQETPLVDIKGWIKKSEENETKSKDQPP